MIIRRSLIIATLAICMIFCNAVAQAAERWCAVAGSVDIPLDDIECFVATDGEYTMNIVLVNGMVLSNVPSVSFALREHDGVNDLVADNSSMLLINNVIHITHANGHDVAMVLDLGGRVIASEAVINGQCSIDITCLPDGVYILNLGKRSIKFTKQ